MGRRSTGVQIEANRIAHGETRNDLHRFRNAGDNQGMKAMLELRGIRKIAGVGSVWALGVLLAALLAGPSPAQAEPYMAVREGYKCSKCHVNQTGGGMRTDYARVYQSTRNTMNPGVTKEEDSSPLKDLGSGRLNQYFAVTADLRADLTYTKIYQARSRVEFNHAATASSSEAKDGTGCASCHSTNGGGKRGEVYLQMEPVPERASIVISESVTPAAAPREQFGLVQNLPMNAYVKAGWFRLPTGLNNTFDEPFFHVNQGLGATVPGLETVRGQGVEMGIEPGPYFLSLSLTNPIDLAKNPSAKRVYLHGYAVGRLGMIGASYYYDPISQDEHLGRTFGGIFGGMSLGRFTALLEADQIKSKTSATAESKSAALTGELDFLLTRGQNVKLLYEAFDPDTTATHDRRDRTSLIYEPFVTPYLQTRVGARFSRGPGQADLTKADVNNAKQYFVELHFIY